MKRSENLTELDLNLRRLNDLDLAEQESIDSYQDIVSKIRREKRIMRFQFNLKRTIVAVSTVFVLLLAGWFVNSMLNNPSNLSATDDNDSEQENDVTEDNISEDENSPEPVRRIPTPEFYYEIEGSDAYYMGAVYKVCWETEEKSCSIEPPTDVEEILKGQRVFMADPGQKVTASINPTPGLPRYDHMTITQHRLGEETTVELKGGSFLAPEEPGRYNYLVHFQWDSEFVGEMYGAFSIGVRK